MRLWQSVAVILLIVSISLGYLLCKTEKDDSRNNSAMHIGHSDEDLFARRKSGKHEFEEYVIISRTIYRKVP